MACPEELTESPSPVATFVETIVSTNQGTSLCPWRWECG